MRTGFITKKGDLIRRMIYPKELNMAFYCDTYKFLGYMACLALLGYFISLTTFIAQGYSVLRILIRLGDLFGTAVPPGLPACLAIGLSLALLRIRARNIYCISPQRITSAGCLSYVCLDKTGTLTEDAFTFDGLLSKIRNENREPIFSRYTTETKLLSNDSQILNAMAMCNSLSIIANEEQSAKKLVGDPLEIELLNATRGRIYEFFPDGKATIALPSGIKGTIIKRFPFNPKTKRMSAIVKINNETYVYSKGAPDNLKLILNPATYPMNYDEKLQECASKGLRGISICYKKINSEEENLDEQDLVKNMEFLGFVFFANLVKRETVPVIMELQNAKLPVVMITGDHQNTANSVALECGILNPHHKLVTLSSRQDVDNFIETNGQNESNIDISFNESAFRRAEELKEKEISIKILKKGRVFARMSPDQKAKLVSLLQNSGEVVCMCGDGANDCVSLNTADVGISICPLEASVAAPFTSRTTNISCVSDVLKEGRASLVTSFQTFKYISLYSFIQFAFVLISFQNVCMPTNNQYIFADIFLVIPLAVTMCRYFY